MQTSKICTKCKVEKNTSDFYKDKRKTTGLRSWCKECQKADNKKREHQYNLTRRLYRETHKEESKAKKKDYYIKNKDQILTQNSLWRRTSINGRLLSYTRSAKKRNIDWNLSELEFTSLWQVPCHYCGDDIPTIGIDRIDSTKGYNINNIVPCCTQCNTMKMDYSEKEFLTKIKQIYERQIK